jgi:hypothetical protein
MADPSRWLGSAHAWGGNMMHQLRRAVLVAWVAVFALRIAAGPTMRVVALEQVPTTPAPLNVAEAATRALEVDLWNRTVLWHNAAHWIAVAVVDRQQHELAARSVPSVGHLQREAPSQVSQGRCGGALPPCWIMMRESRGIVNLHDGKWQIIESTWQGYGGYANAGDSPERVQDAKAASMAICNWQPPNYCA